MRTYLYILFLLIAIATKGLGQDYDYTSLTITGISLDTDNKSQQAGEGAVIFSGEQFYVDLDIQIAGDDGGGSCLMPNSVDVNFYLEDGNSADEISAGKVTVDLGYTTLNSNACTGEATASASVTVPSGLKGKTYTSVKAVIDDENDSYSPIFAFYDAHVTFNYTFNESQTPPYPGGIFSGNYTVTCVYGSIPSGVEPVAQAYLTAVSNPSGINYSDPVGRAQIIYASESYPLNIFVPSIQSCSTTLYRYIAIVFDDIHYTNNKSYKGSHIITLPSDDYNPMIVDYYVDPYAMEIIPSSIPTQPQVVTLTATQVSNSNSNSGNFLMEGAQKQLTTGGNEFWVESGGYSTFIAEEQIKLLPGTNGTQTGFVVSNGGYFKATIASNNFCTGADKQNPVSSLPTYSNRLAVMPLDSILLNNNSNNAKARGVQVAIYPNPSTGIVYVDFNYGQPEDVGIVVTDALGKEVYNSDQGTVINAHTELDLSYLTSGLYI